MAPPFVVPPLPFSVALLSTARCVTVQALLPGWSEWGGKLSCCETRHWQRESCTEFAGVQLGLDLSTGAPLAIIVSAYIPLPGAPIVVQ